MAGGNEVGLSKPGSRQDKVQLAADLGIPPLLPTARDLCFYRHHGCECLRRLIGFRDKYGRHVSVGTERPGTKVVAHADGVGGQGAPYFAAGAPAPAGLVLGGVEHVDVLLGAGHHELDRVLERRLAYASGTGKQCRVAEQV